MRTGRFAALWVLCFLCGDAVGAPKAERFRPDPKLPADAGVPYVVITTQEMAPAFQELALWKTRTGIPAQIITLEWLENNPHYPGTDIHERLYALLKDLYLNWRTRWVLLGGDVDIVPDQKIWAVCGQYTGKYSCDVFFSDVLPGGPERGDPDKLEAYGWNSNGDRYVGEVNKDKFDMDPELFVGRIPVENATEARAYFDKYFDYVLARGGDFSYLDRALVVGAKQFEHTQVSLVDLFKRLGGGKFGAKLLVEEKPDPIRPISDELNKGYAFFDFFGHGCNGHFWATDDHKCFGTEHVEALRNTGKYPVVFGNSCNTNEFARNDCFGEKWLLTPRGGGVAYIGYTAVSFAGPNSVLLYEAWFSGDCPELGRAVAIAKEKRKSDNWYRQIVNLLGDPEMFVRTSAPKRLKMQPERFVAGVPARVAVTDGSGAPQRKCRVLLETGSDYLTAVTDEDGKAVLGIPSRPGSGRLSAVAQNAFPLETKVKVDPKAADDPAVPIPRPSLAVDDSANGQKVHGDGVVARATVREEEDEGGDPGKKEEPLLFNGNGQKDLNPGEVAQCVFTWPLKPGETLPAGTLKLEIEEDPFVRCLTPERPAGGGPASFAVQVDPRVPSWHQVWMTLSYGCEGEETPRVWRYRLPVEGPAVGCVSCAVDDSEGNKDRRIGWEDAGTTIRLGVGLFNRGTQPARSLVLTLSSQDPAVAVLQPTIRLPILPCQDLVETKPQRFEFKLAPDYDAHPIECILTIEDQRKSAWRVKLLFTVPPAPPLFVHVDETGLRMTLLSWLPGGSEAVAGYHVYRTSDAKGSYKRLTEQPVRTGTTYLDRTVKPKSRYFYAVTSVSPEGLESRLSSPAGTFTLTPLPKGSQPVEPK